MGLRKMIVLMDSGMRTAIAPRPQMLKMGRPRSLVNSVGLVRCGVTDRFRNVPAVRRAGQPVSFQTVGKESIMPSNCMDFTYPNYDTPRGFFGY
jgi:hypothetical protein